MNEENIINKEMVEEFENVIKEFKDFRKIIFLYVQRKT